MRDWALYGTEVLALGIVADCEQIHLGNSHFQKTSRKTWVFRGYLWFLLKLSTNVFWTRKEMKGHWCNTMLSAPGPEAYNFLTKGRTGSPLSVDINALLRCCLWGLLGSLKESITDWLIHLPNEQGFKIPSSLCCFFCPTSKGLLKVSAMKPSRSWKNRSLPVEAQ